MNQDVERKKRELIEAVHGVLNALPAFDPAPSPAFQAMIAALAEFSVRARSYVQRNSYGAREIISIPDPESPTRMAQQLAQLAKGSALLGGRAEVNALDHRVAQRAAFDSIPPIRRKLIDAWLSGMPLDSKSMPGSTRLYATGDLEAVKLAESGWFSSLAQDLLKMAGYELPARLRKTDGLRRVVL